MAELAPEFHRPYTITVSPTVLHIRYESGGVAQSAHYVLCQTRPNGLNPLVQSVRAANGRWYEYGVITQFGQGVRWVAWPVQDQSAR